MNKKPIIIGVAGGSGSGKTTVSRALYEHFSGFPITIIEQDYYYKDQSQFSPASVGCKITITHSHLIMS